jgi:hypothetical protein
MSNAVQEAVKIDPVFKAEWLAALRSGNYEQAKGALALTGNT